MSDTGATLFSGRLARPARRHRAAAASTAALDTASGDDILEALPEGLDTVVSRARPQLLRRPAAAAGARPRARPRPGDPGAGRADLRRRRAHRGPDRRPAARPPGRPDHRGHDQQPADARRRRRGRVPRAAAGSSRPARTPSCWPRNRRYRAVVTREAEPDRSPSRRWRSRDEHDAAGRRRPRGPPLRRATSPAGTRGCCGARWPCTCWPRSPRWPRRGCSATWSRPSRTAPPPRYVDRIIAAPGRLPGRADGAHPLRPLRQPGARRAGAGRAARGLRRQHARAARSASSSRPAPATCSPAPAATSTSSAGRCAGRCPSGRSPWSPRCSPSRPRSASAGGSRCPACSASRRW